MGSMLRAGCAGVIAIASIAFGFVAGAILLTPTADQQGGQQKTRQEQPAQPQKERHAAKAADKTEPAPEKTQNPEAKIRAAAEDYYAHVEQGDWNYTYDHLDSETQGTYTYAEWATNNEALASGSVTYTVESVEITSPSVANVNVALSFGDGSTEVRHTYFVRENGQWLHRFSSDEYALFASVSGSASASASPSAVGSGQP
jgi:hypothetical protein